MKSKVLNISKQSYLESRELPFQIVIPVIPELQKLQVTPISPVFVCKYYLPISDIVEKFNCEYKICLRCLDKNCPVTIYREI